jgi:hypothetical protein
MFFMLMVGALESLSAPFQGLSSMFLCVDGGRSRITISDTSHGAHRQCFLS